MKLNMRVFGNLIASTVFLLAATTMNAQASVAYIVDFQDVPGPDYSVNVASDGFNFQSGFGGWTVGDGEGTHGQSYFGSSRYYGHYDFQYDNATRINLPGPGLRMTALSGNSFSVTGFRASTYNTTSETLTVVGNLLGGGTVSSTFALTAAPTNFILNLLGLESADFYIGVPGSSSGFQLDNIVGSLSTVPLPSAGWLLVSALGAFAVFGRRRANKRSAA